MQNMSSQPKPKTQPKFGGIPPNAFSQFGLDLLGVWAPKIPMSRSTAQFAEDAFLENIENGAFYFTIPIAAPLMAKGLASGYRMVKGGTSEAKQGFVKQVGTSWGDLAASKGVKTAEEYLARIGPDKAKRLLGAKAGSLIGVVALASGYEYMIQHAKNVMTAFGFNTKNFTAVAGLEGKQDKAVAGEMDPVKKAAKRTWQVGSLMGGGFLLAAATPYLVRNVSFAESAAKKLLSVCNFSSSDVGKVGKEAFFDITKPLLAVLAGIGAVSYIDASRDHFERKETASRLALVIPYMLFGKELAGNALAYLVGKTRLKVDGKSTRIDDIVALRSGGFGDSLRKAFKSKETFLQLDMTKSKDVLEKELAGKSKDVIESIVKRNKYLVGWGRFALGALVCGVGINWMSYQQTKQRFKRQQEALQKPQIPQQRLRLQTNVTPLQGQVVHQSYGGFAAQGKPLEDPASVARTAIPAPRPQQAPFQGARTSINPSYGYGQWRI